MLTVLDLPTAAQLCYRNSGFVDRSSLPGAVVCGHGYAVRDPIPNNAASTTMNVISIPLCAGQLEMSPLVGGIASTSNDINGEAAKRRFLVLLAHVGPGLAHGFNDLIKTDTVGAIAEHSQP
jgi:hypothetical protein